MWWKWSRKHECDDKMEKQIHAADNMIELQRTKEKHLEFVITTLLERTELNCVYLPLNLNFTEAEAYINLLQTEGVNTQVDVDADSCKLQLPDWYDANLFKRCVPFYLSNSNRNNSFNI